LSVGEAELVNSLRIHFVLAIALARADRFGEAEKALLDAERQATAASTITATRKATIATGPPMQPRRRLVRRRVRLRMRRGADIRSGIGPLEPSINVSHAPNPPNGGDTWPCTSKTLASLYMACLL
jgi:hypothetical protein